MSPESCAPIAHSCRTTLLLGVWWVVASAGCGSGRIGPVSPPSLSPEEAAQAAMAEYDANKDGVLDEKELARCPALKNLGREKNNRVSAVDIATRLTNWSDKKIGVIFTIPVAVVWSDGKPVAGATITVEPEKFMGGSFTKSTGQVGDAGGVANLTTENGLPGCQWGFFKVRVSLVDGSGQEKVPARYNENTELGCEVPCDRTLSPTEFRFVLSK